MSMSDKRLEELLERWLASVDLHARYLQLDDAAYARAESWPKHQRPNALVIQLARTRLLELRAHLSERRDAGDHRFAEALELMSFLTSLLGSEHLERFVPMATGKPPDTSISATIEQPRIRPTHAARALPRKQPRKEAAAAHAPARPSEAPRPVESAKRAKEPAARPAAPPPPARQPAAVAAAAPPPGNAMSRQVVADAIRMLQWGREWPAIAGLIARMADRPSEADIWKILRAHRAEILAQARRSAG
jgi:hypothetical protein